MPILSDIQSLSPGALIELFILDCTPFGGGIYHFHNHSSPPEVLTGDENEEWDEEYLTTGDYTITFQSQVYQPFPIQAVGFECNGRGQANRPKLSVSNIDGLISGISMLYDDLVGAKVTRKRTFGKYLDNESSADPTAELPMEIYYIERKSKENKQIIEYELAGIWDLDGIMLPRRQVCATACMWTYRADGCYYDGPPVAKFDDTPTNDYDLDVCGKRVSSCKLRWGENNPLPFGGFPAVGRMGNYV